MQKEMSIGAYGWAQPIIAHFETLELWYQNVCIEPVRQRIVDYGIEQSLLAADDFNRQFVGKSS